MSDCHTLPHLLLLLRLNHTSKLNIVIWFPHRSFSRKYVLVKLEVCCLLSMWSFRENCGIYSDTFCVSKTLAFSYFCISFERSSFSIRVLSVPFVEITELDSLMLEPGYLRPSQIHPSLPQALTLYVFLGHICFLVWVPDPHTIVLF